MKRQSGSFSLLIPLLVLATQAGCNLVPVPRLTRPPLVSELAPPPDGKPSQHDKDLPPDEQARIQAAFAEELEKNGDELKALALYEKARKGDPDHYKHVCRRLAVLYDRQGDFQTALAEYQKALALAPHDADLLNDLGYGYYSRGRWAEAEKYLREALAAKPKHQRATMNLALCVGEQGRCDEALELFGRVVTPAQAQCNLAFILTTQHKWPEARQTYEKALQLDPDIPLARAALARLEKAEQAPPAKQVAGAPPAKPEGNFTTGFVQWDAPAEEQPRLPAPAPVRKAALPALPSSQQAALSSDNVTWKPAVRPELGGTPPALGETVNR